jgi:hypothetical protein
MTGRQLIHCIVESCNNLDEEVLVQILYRDRYNCVEKKDQAGVYTFINGKLYIESDSIVKCDYV